MPAPLDLLFLDEGNRVVEIASQVPPRVMSAKVTAAAGVLELPAGTIPITHTEIGDKIETEAVVAGETTLGERGCHEF